MIELFLIGFEGFDWDEGNLEKNWQKHQVSREESEEVFGNEPIIITEDPKHSQLEQRYSALGRANNGRELNIIFTLRKNKLIRVISARNMNKRERLIYEKEVKKNS